MMTDKAKLGAWGEIHAQRYMRKQGFKIADANYKSRFGEIDLICYDKSRLVFIEVKSRSQAKLASAMEYVDEAKQKRVMITAEYFMRQYSFNLQPRFDVIEVYCDKSDFSKPVKINHIENAF